MTKLLKAECASCPMDPDLQSPACGRCCDPFLSGKGKISLPPMDPSMVRLMADLAYAATECLPGMPETISDPVVRKLVSMLEGVDGMPPYEGYSESCEDCDGSCSCCEK
jgi:hypothetical protein